MDVNQMRTRRSDHGPKNECFGFVFSMFYFLPFLSPSSLLHAVIFLIFFFWGEHAHVRAHTHTPT
jgi:hypothetical protein